MPFHQSRRWSVVPIEEAAQLAHLLTERTWTCCQGFRHAGYLYLNDATSEDGAQEYAVIREADGRQVESITFSWLDTERAVEHIANITSGELCEDLGSFDLSRIEPFADHRRCRHCA